MKNISILHLSDTHICSGNSAIISERIKEVCACTDERKLIPELIVFSGDAADRGNSDEYSLFREKVVLPLLDHYSLDSHRFVIVPGNHDVDRSKVDSLQQAGVTQLIPKPEEMDSLWRNVEQRSMLLSRQQAFIGFANSSQIQHNSAIIEISGISVGVACLNSAWLSASDKDRNQLAVTRAQLNESSESISHADLKLGIMHHPLSWLHDSDAVRVRTQIFQRFELLLHGHLHEDDGATILSPAGELQQFSCNALYAKGEQCGFMFYDICIQTRSIAAYCFRWSEKNAKFVPNTEFSADGLWNANLPGREAVSNRALTVQRKTSLSGQTKFQAKLSRQLPSIVIGKRELSVEEKFLEPYIVSLNLQKERKFRLQEVIQSNNNYIIEALPQAGKTALLDRIGLKLTELGMIAILVEYDDISKEENGKKGLIGLLSNKTGASKADIKSILDGKILLLIDNCILRYQMPEWARLNSWLSDCPSLRIIAAGRASSLPQSLEDVGRMWKFLSLRPLPVAMVKKEVSRLERIANAGSLSQSNIHSTVSTLIDAELPRWPWVILLLFELAQKFQISDVRSVEGILRKYSDHRLGAFEAGGTDRPSIRARLLRILATDMIDTQVKILSREMVISRFDQIISASGQEESGCETVKGVDILRELTESQLLSESHDGVAFTFFVLQDFFHAEHLRDTLWSDVSQLDLDSVIRKSGALVFFAEKVQLPSLLRRCLELAHSVRGTAPVSNLIESLANLRGSTLGADATVAKAQAAFLAEDEVEQLVCEAEQSQSGSRARRAMSRPGAMEPLEQFIHSFSTAVAILRGSGFLDKSIKQESVQQVLDLAISIVAEISVDKNLLRAVAEQESDESLRRDIAAIINAVLVIVVSSMLAVLGAGKHLTTTLREMFNTETDDLKRLMLLMWYAEVGGTRIDEMVTALVRAATYAFTVRLTYAWLFTKFVTVRSFGSASAKDAERLLRIVAEEQVRRLSDNKTTTVDIKAETDRVVQTARNARLLHNPNSDPE